MILVCAWCARQFNSKKQQRLCPDCKFFKAREGTDRLASLGLDGAILSKVVKNDKGGERMGLKSYGASSGSKYPPLLKAEDIKKPVTYTVASAEERTFKDGKAKLVLGFKETEKQFVVNKTNAGALAESFGDVEPKEIIGKQITLASISTQYQGQPTKGIRVVG